MFDKTNPTSLFSRILKESGEVEIAKGAQIPVTEELERLTLRLRKYDADFHKVFDMAIDRGDIPSGAGGREYYGRDAASTSIPELTSYDDLVEPLQGSVAGRLLARLGAHEDVPFCARVDVSTTVPLLRPGRELVVERYASARRLAGNDA